MLEIVIPEPFQFNPLKHHLAFIRDFTVDAIEEKAAPHEIGKLIRHIGSSVMDIYTGKLTTGQIILETGHLLNSMNLTEPEKLSEWTGTGISDFRTIELSDKSLWTIKYHKSGGRYIHIFPARNGPYTIRVKANTLKSAILYIILAGNDYITENVLNEARSVARLSPIREIAETEAITGMIEILRNQ